MFRGDGGAEGGGGHWHFPRRETPACQGRQKQRERQAGSLGLSKDGVSVLLGQARPPPGSTPPLQGLFLLLENRPE